MARLVHFIDRNNENDFRNDLAQRDLQMKISLHGKLAYVRAVCEIV